MREKLLKLLSEADNLPALPEILVRLESILSDPDCSIDEIAALLSTEPVLSARVMTLSNSAYYSTGRQQVENLNTAIVRLGLKEVRKLVYSIELARLFESNNLVDLHLFWRHSLAVAIYTQMICERIGADKEEADTAYMAGLMHDVGIMVFGYLVPEQYNDFLKRIAYVDRPLQDQERETFGIEHAELGAEYIKQWWTVEESIGQAVANHHFPFSIAPDIQLLSQVVNVANGICNNQGVGNGIDVPSGIFSEGAWLNLGLTLEDAGTLMDQVKESINRAEAMLL